MLGIFIMAKSNKGKASKRALSSGQLQTHEAITQFFNSVGRLPDADETLRKAGISRQQLETLLDDDEIGQAVETRLDALLATPYRIEPGDTPQAKIIMSELQEWFVEIATAGFNALLFGYSVQEAVWGQKDGYWGLSWIGEKPMQWFEPKPDGRLIYRPDSFGVEREVDRQFKFFLTQRKATYRQPYGKALLSILYWLFYFKQNGFKFWAKFLERFGTPILLGKCKDTETEDMIHALLSAHAQSVISIDVEDDVQILSNTQGNAGAAFDTFHTVIIRQIQKLILGQTLTSGTDGTGSRALGEVHENVRKDKLKSDVRLIKPTFQSIVDAICTMNGWESHTVVLGEDKSLNKEQAERDVKLKAAGANLTQQYFQREYGLQDGDVAEQQVLPFQQFSALPQKAFSFAADVKKLSPEQKEVEELTDEQPSMRLLTNEQVNIALNQSESVEDLVFELTKHLPDASKSEFTTNLERALFQADVMGYVLSSEGK